MSFAQATRPRGNAIPPVVHDVLRSTGRPLDNKTRAEFEPRFGQDFSRVRVHDDVHAASSALAVGARAYTAGSHIVLGRGESSPSVIAHELAHVVQQSGSSGMPQMIGETGAPAEREADRAADQILRGGIAPAPKTDHAPALRRIPMPRTSTTTTATTATQAQQQQQQPATTKRARAEQTLRNRFGVTSVIQGTYDRKNNELKGGRTPPPPDIDRTQWQDWMPGPDDVTWDYVIDAFNEFESAFGASAVVNEIVFYEAHWELQNGIPVRRTDVGGAFGGSTLEIFSAVTVGHALPVARSNAAGNYPLTILQSTGIPGQTPGAPHDAPNDAESAARNLVHELGHGVMEAALRLDSTAMTQWMLAAGWSGTTLFDIGAPGVEAALRAGTPPPAQYQITENDWNDPKWVDQPVSHYAVKGGAGEDFAESVMLFVRNPRLLLARSPKRYRYIDQNRAVWQRSMRPAPRPKGDFPMPQGDTRAA